MANQSNDKARRSFAGLSLPPDHCPLIMGIINATPDSFSDGGEAFRVDDAIRRGRDMVAAGAHILDVGGESTRPGAAPVSLQEELNRTIPVVEGLAGEGFTVSIDTRHADVMREATKAGAKIINDVSALTGEGALEAAASTDAAVVLMHMQGEPGTMQAAPTYDDVVEDVYAYLQERIKACEEAGIVRDRLAIDPGIGFGKTLDHNLALLRGLERFQALGVPVLLGTSRKSFIGMISGEQDAKKRISGSLASNLAGIERGADILRVHDVADTVQAIKVWQAIKGH